MRLVYNVYDDENQIESKQFDNFPDALEYAKQGLITYICEEDLDCPGCEERVVWTWDSTWDDEEAIAEVTSKRENADLFNEVNPFDRVDPVSEEPVLTEDIEINISGPAEEVRDLASLVFGGQFDLEWDTPVEEVKVDEQNYFFDEFGYEDEPAVKDLDFDVDNPFEDDLFYSEEKFEDEEEFEDEDKLEDEEEFEVGEPEIVEDPDIKSKEDQPEELELSKDSDVESLESEDEENKEDSEEELDESLKEEVKLATNKRGDYLVAADSGKGYTVFNRNNVYIGGFDGEDDQKAIDKFNKGEFKESLKESLNLPTMRVSEIKDELDLHGDIYFDLLEPIDESDEDGWRGASEIRIVNTGSRYEIYFEWLDQDGDYVESDPEFTYDTLEELLREIDGFYVTIVDLEEYFNGTLDEAIKMTKDELLDKEGTTDVDLINAGRPEEERVELEEGRQPVYSHVIFYYYDENNNENTITKINLVPKDIRAEVDNLIKCGATRVYVDAKINGEWEPLDKYTYDPEWTPGTPEYAARNSKDFALAVESLDQEDDLTDQEFAEQLQARLQETNIISNVKNRPEAPKDLTVVKEPGDQSISEGDFVWFDTRKGEDIVIKVIQATRDQEGKCTNCKFVYTEPKVTRPHKERKDWWKKDSNWFKN